MIRFQAAASRAAFFLAMLTLGIAGTVLVQAPAQADSLTTPARSSARAQRSLMLALAPAGARLVAVGERGIVIYSDDDGVHWIQATVPVSVTLTAVHFTDASRGFAVGHDGAVLSSTDGGKNWRKRLDGNAINTMMQKDAEQAVGRARDVLAHARDQNAAKAALEQAENATQDVQAALKFGPSRPLLAVWFKDAHIGWTVGAYGQVLRTRDGGATWTSLATRIANPEGLHYNALGHGADGALLIAGEGGRIYRSNDDGDSWRTLDTGYKGQLYGVIETAPGILLAYGFGGHALLSADGGARWQPLPQLGNKNLIGAALAGDGRVLLGARDGAIYRSVDQGRSFTAQPSAHDLELAGMALLGPKLALVGVGGIHLAAASTAGKQQP